jgi:hypothetical protein
MVSNNVLKMIMQQSYSKSLLKNEQVHPFIKERNNFKNTKTTGPRVTFIIATELAASYIVVMFLCLRYQKKSLQALRFLKHCKRLHQG